MGECILTNRGGSGGSRDILAKPEYVDFTGEYQIVYETDPKNWKMKLLSSGVITFSQNVLLDLFLVGGGGSGMLGSENGGAYGGGGGGYCNTYKNAVIEAGSYTITIGAGGANADGGSTTFHIYTAIGGKKGGSHRPSGCGGSGGGAGTGDNKYFLAVKGSGGKGGSNGSDGYANASNTIQNPREFGTGQLSLSGQNTREFGEDGAEIYAGGGGGGAVFIYADPTPQSGGDGGAGGSVDPNLGYGTPITNPPWIGGKSGGNIYSGGGGGGYGGGGGGGGILKYSDSANTCACGNGCQGIVVIRNTRNT